MESARLTRLTPATLMMALITAYCYGQDSGFDLLQALNKKPKKDSEEPSQKLNKKEQKLEATAAEQAAKANVGMSSLVPMGQGVVAEVVEEAVGATVKKLMDEGKIDKARVLVGEDDEALISLPYFEAYHTAMETGRSMAVFVVRTDDKDITGKINKEVLRWEAAGFRRFLNIAIVGPKNPNLKAFSSNSSVARDPDIEMTAYYKRNGKWGTNHYIGMTAVQGIMDRMTKWLDEKDAWEKKKKAEGAAAEAKKDPPRPRDTFNLVKPLHLVR